LIEIRCTAWDVGQCPAADSGADGRHIHLQEEVAKGRIRGRMLELYAERHGQHSVVPARETFQISQALTLAQDPEKRHQKHVPGWNPDAPPHPGIRERPSSPGKQLCDGLSNRPALKVVVIGASLVLDSLCH